MKAVKLGNSIRIENNFIPKSDDMISHVRLHERKADYSENGKHADKLQVEANWINKPDSVNYSNQWMTKQCFWLNNSYIKKQVIDLLSYEVETHKCNRSHGMGFIWIYNYLTVVESASYYCRIKNHCLFLTDKKKGFSTYE